MSVNLKLTSAMRGLGFCSCCFIMVGCESTSESRDINTKNIRASYTLSADATTIDVVASFREDVVGADPVVRLTNGDRLAVISPGNVRTFLVRSGDQYRVSLGNAMAGEYRLELNRSNDVDANNSRLSLPQPVGLFEPVSGTIIDTQTQLSLPVRWVPASASAKVNIKFSYACSGGGSYADVIPVDDGGQFNYNATAFLAGKGTDSSGCQLKVEIERTIGGAIDRALDGRSTITATQKESATVSLQ